jgi:histidyl-tRNA synthetase
MKYADKLGSPAVIFYGENEIKSRKVTLKNLKSGQEISVEMESLVDEIKKLL